MATGRSDYPNQVNNVLGFPFIFRGALDVGASEINEQMKMAAVKALANLTKEDVPDSVIKAYGGKPFKFGREYLIPKPFDYRVLLWEAPAVAEAAIKSGVARHPYSSKDDYIRELESRVSRIRRVMHVVMDRAKADPKKIVFAEGDHPKIVRAAKILVEDGVCKPILLGSKVAVEALLKEFEVPKDKVEVVEPASYPKFQRYAEKFHQMRWRRGLALEDAIKALKDPVYFGNMMVHEGDADGLISGLTMHYPDTIRPTLQIQHTRPDVSRAAGVYLLLLEDRMIFIADTTVTLDPTAEELAEIAYMAADVARTYFEVEPKIAMLSYSNFGSNADKNTAKVRKAVEIAHERWPELTIDGEMQADTAVEASIAQETYPLSAIKGDANILICPDLESANIAYKLVWRLGKVEVIGPILAGVNAAVHVLQRGVDVADVVNMTAMCVLKAQNMEELRKRAKKR
jgi:malate dehydrogenase (oxaloacetate-decarboxylating)(NADP+)